MIPRSGLVAAILALALIRPSLGLITADDPPPEYPHLQFEGATPCPVVGVIDPLRVLIRLDGRDHPVRLLGVAVPAEQAGRPAARQALARMLLGESVYVQFDEQVGHESSAVYLFRAPDGLLVNLELVRAGYTRAAPPDTYTLGDLFTHYEQIARRHGKGLWSADEATRPLPRAHARATRSNDANPIAADGTVVYITRTGAKYHRQDCPHARKSGRPIALREAARRYGPCSRCDPPVADD